MLQRHVQTTVLAIGAALCLSACAASTTPAASPTLAGPSTSPTPATEPVVSPATPVTGATSPAAETCSAASAVLFHQAPELEAMLPASVQARRLTRWSVRGRCWPELALEGGPVAVDDFVEQLETRDGAPINLDNLAYAVGGRSDTSTDPPYFVWVANRPLDEDEINLTLVLLFGGAGYHDVAAGIDPQNYEQRKIAGKEVHVGTEDMLSQNDHQRGRPYFYETEDQMFLLITDDDAWAADAIGQLP